MKKEKATFQIQIPAKLILFGEWAVLDGYSALGCSVGKYFTAELTPKEDASSLTLESHEVSFDWHDIEEKVPPFLERTSSILKSLFKNPLILKGHVLKLYRNWKLSEGLGSSSALYLALSCLEKNFSQSEARSKTLTEEAVQLRKKLVAYQGSGSGFDILLQSVGTFLKAEIKNDSVFMEKVSLKIPEEILFVHTGKKMKTDVALKEQRGYSSFSKDLGQSCEEFLLNQDWQKTIYQHNKCLEKMGVVPNFVKELKDSWIEKKWIRELKTTGAGGGDTLMLFINPCKRPELEADLTQRGFWLEEAPLGVPGALETNL
ncbi:MAG: hypothetical protein R3A80_11835 [Bdellovibrionota bacterium]